MATYQYVGEELELFASALNWKSYFRSNLKPYLQGSVLEVGAGLGGTTAVLLDDRPRRWVALEPDPQLAGTLAKSLDKLEAGKAEIRIGTIADLGGDETFDAVLYIDVLEHIEADREELQAAARHVARGGALIVLSPAHQFLFSPFDAALGHYRRYNSRQLAALRPAGLTQESIKYFDSAGMMLSLGNKMLLRQSIPTAKQIRVWDRYFVPVSRLTDRLLRYRVGKSIIAVWRNQN